jgi:hypothetical protein
MISITGFPGNRDFMTNVRLEIDFRAR